MACFFLYLGYAGLRRGSGPEAKAARKAVTMVAAELSQTRIAMRRSGLPLVATLLPGQTEVKRDGLRRVEERTDKRLAPLAPASYHCEELP